MSDVVGATYRVVDRGGIEQLRQSFFFFKQKTAYDVLGSLVGSEMCIRDRTDIDQAIEKTKQLITKSEGIKTGLIQDLLKNGIDCLLYTSDAADDLLCVALGGRRRIKKKKITHKSQLERA